MTGVGVGSLSLRALVQHNLLTEGEWSSPKLPPFPPLPNPLNEEMKLLAATGLGTFKVMEECHTWPSDDQIQKIAEEKQVDAMTVLTQAAEWSSWAMGNTLHGVPEARLVRRSSNTWHFSGAPTPCEIFKITNARHLVFDDVYGQWMSNWCHVGKGATLVSKWQVSNVEGEQEEWDEEGEEQEEWDADEEEQGQDQAEQEGQEEGQQGLVEQQEEKEEQEQEKAWSVCLHLQKDSLLMENEGDCGTSTLPGISRGTARYARVPVSGTGRREEGAAVEEPLQLQPLRDGQVYLFQKVTYSWPNRDFTPATKYLSDALFSPLVVKTEKVEMGWQMVDETDGWQSVVFTGVSEENNCQATLDWHRKKYGTEWFFNNVELEHESSSMRLLANGILEVTRKRLLPYLLHPEAQVATSTAHFRPFTGLI